MATNIVAELSSTETNAFIAAAPVGVIGLDERMHVVIWNEMMETLSGIHAESVYESSIASIFPAFDEPRVTLRIDELLRTGTPVIIHSALHPGLLTAVDGAVTIAHYRITARPVDDSGRTRVVLWIENHSLLQETISYLHAEITRREAVERELQSSIRGQTVLFRELQHRVKNSLAIIHGLISLGRMDTDASSESVLQNVERRIGSIALVYEQLSARARYGELDLAQYVRELVTAVVDSAENSMLVDLPRFRLDECVVPVDTAVSIGLIVNEIVTNSLKHAFPAGRRGSIQAELRHVDNRCTLTIADDGVGFVEPAEPVDVRGLGIIAILADQVAARVTRTTVSGTSYTIDFTCAEVPSLE